MICDGIQDTVGECFAVTYQEHTGFSVGTGKAWLGGHYFMNHSSYYLNLKAYQNSAMDRYVTIAIRCDLTERKCDIAMIPGTPADVPEPEFPENSDKQTFLTLATVLLPAGGDADQSCITDYRSDPKRCGFCRCILGKCKLAEALTQDELHDDLYELNGKTGLILWTYPDMDRDGHITEEKAKFLEDYVKKVENGDYDNFQTESTDPYDIELAKWEKYAKENGHENYIFPDADGDGKLTSRDVEFMREFIKQVGEGKREETQDDYFDFVAVRRYSLFNFPLDHIKALKSAEKYENSAKSNTLFIVEQEPETCSMHFEEKAIIDPTAVRSDTVKKMVTLTQEAYDALESTDPSCMYIIVAQ